MLGSRLGTWLLVGTFSLGALGCSCSSDDSAGTGGNAGSGGAAGGGGTAGSGGTTALSLFDVWRAAQISLRQSPDHLTARAEALVKEGDPAKIHAFVRDEIVTYPPTDDSMYGAVDATRWGIRATLRGGAGTPREKAELLVDLYTRAGLTAEVVAGPLDTSRADGKAILHRSIQRTFAPVADDATRAQWLDVLKKPAPAAGQAIDLDFTQSKSLASSLEGLASSGTSDFDFALGDIPLVRVQVGGSWQYANPLVADAALGDPVTSADPGPTSSANATPSVKITLQASRTDAPYDRFTLVEGTFSLDDVAGRRINLAFAPSLPADSLASVAFRDVTTFIPVLSVHGADVSVDEQDSLSQIGTPVTLGGDVFDVSSSNDVIVNGVSLGSGPSDPTAVASVQTLGLGVHGEAFQRIDLRVSALDAGGKNVPGLRSDVFRVLEDGQPVAATISQNDAGPPKVILLQDVSTSLPPEYLGAGAVDFGNQIITPLYAKYPNAQVQVGVVDYGVIYAPGGWATSLAAAQTEVAWLATATGSSEIYQAVADVQKVQPTVVILVTDGNPSDTLEPEFQAKIANGAPVLGIGVGTAPMMDSLNSIAALSGGLATTAANKLAAINAAISFIDARSIEDYLISYHAPKAGASTRQVKVEFDNARLSATGSYDVPSTPAPEQALAGLYLSVKVGDREITRTLAGFDRGFTTAYQEIAPEVLEDVRAMLFGRVTFEVEGAGVTPSEWLDDWLGEKLGLETAYDALLAKDEAKIRAAAKQGFHITPPKLYEMLAGLPASSDTDALTFEHGARVAAVVQKVRFGKGLERQMNMFPKAVWRTASQNPSAAWKRTLEHTAYLAVAEKALYTDSTSSLLAGTPLSSFTPGTINDLPSLDQASKLRWSILEGEYPPSEYTLLAPSTGTPFAFWALHTPSGSVIGVLPNGSGGGIEDELNDNLADTEHMLNLIGDIGSLAGANVGFWVKLEKTKAQKVTAATIIIAGGQADIGDWEGELGHGICDAVAGAATGNLPGMDTYGNIQEAVSQGSYWSGLGEVNLPDLTPDICP